MIFAYTRVSTAEQAADGSTSLAEQERKCRAIAQLRGADPTEVIVYSDPGVSGSIPLGDRPGGAKLITDTVEGDIVVAAKLDRMFRSASDALVTAETFKKRGIHLILIDQGSDPVTSNGVGKLFFSLLAAVAEFERERITERMTEGRKAKKIRAGHTGGKYATYGYRIEGHRRESRFVEDPHEQSVISRVKRMAQSGLGPQQIVLALRDDGIFSRTGRIFQTVQIQRILNAG